MGRHAKIQPPTKQELNHMYWFEEMTFREIGNKYGMNHNWAGYWMKVYKIPCRAAGVRVSEECRVDGCKEMVCRVKRWVAGAGWYWGNSVRCARHTHEHKRRVAREWSRRVVHKRYKGIRRYTRRLDDGHAQRLKLGTSSIIAKEDS